MFRLLKLAPPHGWRAIWWELGIVTLGVLIALGAGEIAQRVNWTEQVDQAEAALNAQLAESQFASLERIARKACEDQVLDQLDGLIDGEPRPAMLHLGTIMPLRPWGTSTWDAASASGAVAHMRPERRSLYADLFHFTGILGTFNQREFELASDLKTLERHGKLTETSRDRLSRDVSQLRELNRIMALGARQWLEDAKPLSLKFSEEDRKDLAAARRLAHCTLEK